MSDEQNQQLQAVVPYRAPVGTDTVKPFIPADFPSVYNFSQLIAESGMAPKDMKRPEQIAVAIFHGLEVGMTPMAALQSIAVINGRPSIWGDGALAMVRGSGHLEDIEEFYEGEFPDLLGGSRSKSSEKTDSFKAVCIVTRKGAKRPVRFEFSIADAKLANLWTKAGPWMEYPKRMLKMRARAFAIRDEFTDVMRGLAIAEEVNDYHDVTPRDENPPAPDGEDEGTASQAEPKKRGRPAGAKNKYQADNTTIEGETVKNGEETSKDPIKPAETKTEDPKEPEKPKETAKPVETKKEETAKPAGERNFAKEVSAIVPDLGNYDAEFRDYLKDMHREMSARSTMEELRAEWSVFFNKRKSTPEEIAATKFIRDHHKDRIGKLAESAAADENPPAPGDENPPTPGDDGGTVQFDYEGFKAELEEKLSKCETAADVNALFSDYTEMPVRDGLITEKQLDEDLKPLALSNLERVDV